MRHEAITDAWATRNKLCVEGDKLCIEGSKRYDEGYGLLTEGDKLRDEGIKRYRDAVVEKYGDKAVFDMKTGVITTL